MDGSPLITAGALADMADAAFVASQVMAIRIDTMRALHGEGIGRGYLEERIDETVRQGEALGRLFHLLYALSGHEAQAVAAIAAVLEGDLPASPARLMTRPAGSGPAGAIDPR